MPNANVQSLPATFTIGTNITYTCDVNKRFIDGRTEQTVSCLVNGQWQEITAGDCQGTCTLLGEGGFQARRRLHLHISSGLEKGNQQNMCLIILDLEICVV